VAKRLFVVEAIAMGAGKSDFATPRAISRQTIHNRMEIKKHFGREGIIQGYNVGASRSRRKRRELPQEELSCGNKSEQVAKIRPQKRQKSEANQQEQEAGQQKTVFGFAKVGRYPAEPIEPEVQPLSEEHGREKTRCAGTFHYLMPLMQQWNWLDLVIGYFGSAYNTLRRMAVPGRTNMVAGDNSAG
jgi:hypothetical protein